MGNKISRGYYKYPYVEEYPNIKGTPLRRMTPYQQQVMNIHAKESGYKRTNSLFSPSLTKNDLDGFHMTYAPDCSNAITPNSLYRDKSHCNTCGWSQYYFRDPETLEPNCVPKIYLAQINRDQYFDIGRTQYYTRADICDVSMCRRCKQ